MTGDLAPPARLKLKIQVMRGDVIAFGPGKAALLEAIDRAGSISGAARAIGLSYRRAWLMVETMNSAWQDVLVATTVGGRKGAKITPAGRAVLADYRALAAACDDAAHGTIAERLLGRMA